MNDMGPGKLAEQFGVDRKTLWRWQRAAELPPRLAETLERMLLERAVAAMEEDRKRVAVLEDRVSDLEGQLEAALAAVNGGGNGNTGAMDVYNAVAEALRQEFAREIQRLERRLDRLGAAQDGDNAPGGGSMTGRAGSQRRYDNAVTREAAEDAKRSSGRRGPWWRNGGSCGRGIRPRARGWPGRRGGSGSWSWRSPCWRSTG